MVSLMDLHMQEVVVVVLLVRLAPLAAAPVPPWVAGAAASLAMVAAAEGAVAQQTLWAAVLLVADQANRAADQRQLVAGIELVELVEIAARTAFY